MISKFDVKIVGRLLKLSRFNDVRLRCSHVAALYYKRRLLSLGVNKTKTHPLAFRLSQSENKKYLHAEVDCLKGVDGDISRCTLYVVRADRKGRLAQSKPCKFCQTYIRELGVGRVVHTVDGGIASYFDNNNNKERDGEQRTNTMEQRRLPSS